MNIDKQARLDALYQEMEVGVCPSLEATSRQLVRGYGDPDAAIVIIGEAPGQDEDRVGQPFVGRAGQLLDSMLASAGLSRQHGVFITNYVKRNPTKLSERGSKSNRPPTEAEKVAYRPYMERELGVLGARAVITLGAHSTSLFVPGVKRLADVKGVPHEVTINGRPTLIVPQYHPSYAIRDSNKEPLLREDFLKAIELIQRQ